MAESEVEAGDAQLAVSLLMFSDARDVGDTPSQHLKGRLWKCVRWQALFYQYVAKTTLFEPGMHQGRPWNSLYLELNPNCMLCFL